MQKVEFVRALKERRSVRQGPDEPELLVLGFLERYAVCDVLDRLLPDSEIFYALELRGSNPMIWLLVLNTDLAVLKVHDEGLKCRTTLEFHALENLEPSVEVRYEHVREQETGLTEAVVFGLFRDLNSGEELSPAMVFRFASAMLAARERARRRSPGTQSQ